MLFISYQNFSSVSSGEWDSTTSLKIINEMNAFRAGDKVPETLATPQSGSDLQSVKNDWMQRQGHILLNGYDKKLEKAMNDKLNSWVKEITAKEEPAENASAQPAGGESPTAGQNAEAKASEDPHKLKQNLRFTRVNSLKYDIGDMTSVNLTADPGNTHVDVSQTLSPNAKFGLEHRTANSQTQMFLKYEW